MIGEETGRLPTVLERLTEYFENKIAQRRQLVSALSYPVLIFFTSVGAVMFMITFIIPMFEEVFIRFNNDLPKLTKTVIDISNAFRSKFPYFLLGSIGIGVLLYAFRSHEKLKWAKEWLMLRLPIVGDIYKQVYLARFCDSMALLISSSVPMLNTLDMVRKMIGFLHIERSVEVIKKDLIQGKSFTLAIGKHRVYDEQMVALIKVGEEVNQLGNFFQKLALDYTNNIRYRTALLSTFLEPVMIIFLGLVVGLILISMYLPMFELSSSMDFGY